MKKWLVTLTSGALLVLAGCGGGSDSAGGATVAQPVFSTLDFPVRAAYDTMMDPAKPIGLNLAGTDNATIDPTTTVTPVNWPSWSKFPPPPPEVTVTPADLRWIGTVTAQRRIPEIAVTTPLGDSTIAVDYFISLKRLRDGREYRDALTVYFDSDSSYRPLAAVTMQSQVWNWLSPLAGLPVTGKIGISSGTAVAVACLLPVGSLSSLVCDPTFFEAPPKTIPVVWSLQEDTAQTAFITFAYRAPFLDALDGASSSEAIVEIKTKIDSGGVLRGVEYVRIEGPLTIRLRG